MLNTRLSTMFAFDSTMGKPNHGLSAMFPVMSGKTANKHFDREKLCSLYQKGRGKRGCMGPVPEPKPVLAKLRPWHDANRSPDFATL